MYTKNSITILITTLYLLASGCKGQSNDGHPSNSTVANDSIDLYVTDPELYRYLPDTALDLSAGNNKQNISKKQAIFDSILEVRKTADTSLLNALMLRNARLLFIDYSNIYRYKYLEANKDNANMNSLAFALSSPYDRHITAEKWLALFDSYPPEMQHSKPGIEAKARLEGYLFEKNLGKSLKSFINELYSNSGLPESNYYVLVFGASWCKPCIEEERALKYWYPKIDSSIVKFIGLSLDNDVKKWESYLVRENFPWKNILVPSSFENRYIKDLGFESIPMNFLLDKELKILRQNIDIRKVLTGIKEIPWRQ